jgi:hypothetical protein
VVAEEDAAIRDVVVDRVVEAFGRCCARVIRAKDAPDDEAA